MHSMEYRVVTWGPRLHTWGLLRRTDFLAHSALHSLRAY